LQAWKVQINEMRILPSLWWHVRCSRWGKNQSVASFFCQTK